MPDTTSSAPRGLRIVLGVTGGIAAYKSVLLLRLFTEAGHRVRVVPTHNALRMVGEATFAALSHEPVRTDVFEDAEGVDHVRLGQEADLVVVAPATADFLARAATGRADDLLGAVLLTAACPVLVAPAMHTEMWNHPATQDNVALLRRRGVSVLTPASGRLTGSDSGIGRLPDPEAIFAAAIALVDDAAPAGSDVAAGVGAAGAFVDDAAPAGLESAAGCGVVGDLAGRHVVISAGGTREAIDPVRYLANASTGVMGVELALAAARAGARVTLVAANVGADLLARLPDEVAVVPVVSAADLRQAVRAAASGGGAGPVADCVIMAAAVADFTPREPLDAKRKRTDAERAGEGGWSIELVPTVDVLAELSQDPPLVGGIPTRPALVVGFAAETGDEHGSVLEYGARKARSKGADLTVVNRVGGGAGFGAVDTQVFLLDGAGGNVGQASGSKAQVAAAIVEAVAARLS
ncbi:bifunctional phosphopantothenoylcysteine decarboxylase/phosphopantothenate synthase [Buchananella felis]|uniref:bifunctional phosphopantothenoylcysteine decarboxylase/phosphopantothenate synthase n=1 Tax=Buchananella felis TaxID=3231492 RepID=UPI0035280559